MATMAKILVDVRRDIYRRVGKTDPGINPTIKWKPYRSNDPKAAEQGGARSFTVDVVTSDGVSFGSTTNDFETVYNLSIKYELGQDWTDAAADDYGAIVSALQRTWTIPTGFPTGLDFYQIGPMAITADEDFQTMTVPITARIAADVRS